MKERRKFLKYFFKEHHGAIPVGRQFVSALIELPQHFDLSSNMSVNAVLNIMQCGYPRAAHINFTRRGAIFEKIHEKSYDLHQPLFQSSFSFG
jgi:hypothetical protein